MAEPVLIFGRTGCGKTVNKYRIAEYLGLKYIEDHVFMNCPRKLESDTLYLTTDQEMATRYRDICRKYEDVIAEIDLREQLSFMGNSRKPQ